MSDKYGLHRDDFGVQVAFIGHQGNICLSNAEIVKHLNGHNNTCEKLTEQNKMLQEQIDALCGALNAQYEANLKVLEQTGSAS